MGIVAILVSHNLSRAALVSAGRRGQQLSGPGAAARPSPCWPPLPRTLSPAAPSASAAGGVVGVACCSGSAPPAAPGEWVGGWVLGRRGAETLQLWAKLLLGSGIPLWAHEGGPA